MPPRTSVKNLWRSLLCVTLAPTHLPSLSSRPQTGHLAHIHGVTPWALSKPPCDVGPGLEGQRDVIGRKYHSQNSQKCSVLSPRNQWGSGGRSTGLFLFVVSVLCPTASKLGCSPFFRSKRRTSSVWTELEKLCSRKPGAPPSRSVTLAPPRIVPLTSLAHPVCPQLGRFHRRVFWGFCIWAAGGLVRAVVDLSDRCGVCGDLGASLGIRLVFRVACYHAVPRGNRDWRPIGSL